MDSYQPDEHRLFQDLVIDNGFSPKASWQRAFCERLLKEGLIKYETRRSGHDNKTTIQVFAPTDKGVAAYFERKIGNAKVLE